MVPLAASSAEKGEQGVHVGVGPHPSYIQVAKPFVFEQTVQDCLDTLGLVEAKDALGRVQGITYIDNVRKALSL